MAGGEGPGALGRGTCSQSCCLPSAPCLVKGSSQIAFQCQRAKQCPLRFLSVRCIYREHLWQPGRSSACGLPQASASRRPVHGLRAWALWHAGKGLRGGPVSRQVISSKTFSSHSLLFS